MTCPKCGRPMSYLNQEYQTHGWYCLESVCKAIVPCDQYCCEIKMEICPRCFGSGNWPWAQWGGPLPCSACDATGKVSEDVHARLRSAPIDRRNPKCPPRPGMIWSKKHQMWTDVDRRTPEEKALHDKIAAEVEKEMNRKEAP